MLNAEKYLWAGVLCRAIEDLDLKQSLVENEDLFFYSSVAWFESKNGTDVVGSFLWVCDFLGLDPGIIKKKAFQRSKPWEILEKQRQR